MKLSKILANRFPHAFLTPRLGTQILSSLGLVFGVPAAFFEQTFVGGIAVVILSTIGLIKNPPIVAIRIVLEILRKKFVSLLGENYRDEVDAYKWRSAHAQEIVARRAIARELANTSDLISEIKNSNWKSINLRWALNYARLLALQPLKEGDLEKSLFIYESVFNKYGSQGLRKRFSPIELPHVRMLLDGLFTLKRYDVWRFYCQTLPQKWIPNKTTAIDLLHPGITHGLPIEPWLDAFNRDFASNNLELIGTSDEKNPSIDTITCDPQNTVQSEIRITVIMSAFNSGQIITAVQSVLNQSWQNLELIIVDDCSAADSYILHAAQLDPRITLIRHTENAGTYEARNSAMRIATGEFITTHDSDDWAHPRRLEIQANTLIENQDLQATLSRALRTGPNLTLSRLGYAPNRQNASSLMFRRQVFDEIGEFDHIRKGADSEYAARISSAYPGGIQLVGFAPLAIIRMGHESLSRSEFAAKWAHPARQMYRSAYLRWHFLNRKSHSRLKPASPRNFLAPRRFLDPKDLASQSSEFDVIVATNVAHSDVLERDILTVQLLVSAGIRVGLVNLSPIGMQNSTPAILQDMLNSGRVHGLCTDDKVSSELLIISSPNIIRLIDNDDWAISTKQVLIAPLRNAVSEKSTAHRLTIAHLDATRELPINRLAVNTSVHYLMGQEPIWMNTSATSPESLAAHILEMTSDAK